MSNSKTMNALTTAKPSKPSAVTTLPPRASLLGLPRELRDTIWELAIDLDQHIFIDEGTFDQPSPIHVCKQMRREVSEIFYRQNNFIIPQLNLNLLLPWAEVFLPVMQVPRFTLEILFRHSPNGSVEQRKELLQQAETTLSSVRSNAKVDMVAWFYGYDGFENGLFTLRELLECGEESFY